MLYPGRRLYFRVFLNQLKSGVDFYLYDLIAKQLKMVFDMNELPLS